MPISATAIRSRIICSVQPDSSRVSPIEHADFSTDWTNSNDSSYRFALFLSGGVGGSSSKPRNPASRATGVEVCARVFVRACVSSARWMRDWRVRLRILIRPLLPPRLGIGESWTGAQYLARPSTVNRNSRHKRIKKIIPDRRRLFRQIWPACSVSLPFLPAFSREESG